MNDNRENFILRDPVGRDIKDDILSFDSDARAEEREFSANVRPVSDSTLPLEIATGPQMSNAKS